MDRYQWSPGQYQITETGNSFDNYMNLTVYVGQWGDWSSNWLICNDESEWLQWSKGYYLNNSQWENNKWSNYVSYFQDCNEWSFEQ